MRKTAPLLFAAALLAAGAASAQQARTTTMAQGTSPLYGELGYTHLDVDAGFAGSRFSARPGALRGIVGYDLHPNLAVEGMLALGIHKDDAGGITGAGIPFASDVKLRHSIGAYVKPKMMLGPVEAFARVGVAQTKLRAQATAAGATTQISDSKADFSWGGGLNWNFSPRSYVGLDLMRYYDVGGTKVDGTTLSIGTRW